ncbi:ribonuclease domain-containing protein [Aliiglaciecola sp. LCG003]|uniref:ribonuclease domain-containing protein n=1 Tax=Aliiglaciecola sp. LCG003 TaxID=3053655 RepID=UPI002572EA00|nr:ribonuclease domain-containing protein [Aliiglaciecola sp. LCG003]WJG07963.1 ribonuclease domain-containing protein [Aliiglaciecola sp. LCG003]
MAGLIPFASEARKLGKVADVAKEGITAIRKGKGALNSFDGASDYIRKNGALPDNFITKKDALALGWNPKKGNLHDIAPGKSIGGDVFHNRQGGLPSSGGRTWKEADINYSGGHRGSDRMLYSSDGLIYKTTDHYKSFTQL